MNGEKPLVDIEDYDLALCAAEDRAEKAEKLLTRIVSHYDIEERHKSRLHGPGHLHSTVGLWDRDGSVCEWCATWSEVVYLVEGLKK